MGKFDLVVRDRDKKSNSRFSMTSLVSAMHVRTPKLVPVTTTNSLQFCRKHHCEIEVIAMFDKFLSRLQWTTST